MKIQIKFILTILMLIYSFSIFAQNTIGSHYKSTTWYDIKKYGTLAKAKANFESSEVEILQSNTNFIVKMNNQINNYKIISSKTITIHKTNYSVSLNNKTYILTVEALPNKTKEIGIVNSWIVVITATATAFNGEILNNDFQKDKIIKAFCKNLKIQSKYGNDQEKYFVYSIIQKVYPEQMKNFPFNESAFNFYEDKIYHIYEDTQLLIAYFEFYNNLKLGTGLKYYLTCDDISLEDAEILANYITQNQYK